MNDRDLAILTELERLIDGGDYDHARIFDMALKKGAGLKFLTELAASARYVMYPGLYVGKLLRAGFSPHQVQTMLVALLRSPEGAAHAEAFWKDRSWLERFDYQALLEILEEVLRHHPAGAFSQYCIIATKLGDAGRRTMPDVPNDDIVRRACADATRLVSQAASGITYVRTDKLLKDLLAYGTSSTVLTVAGQVGRYGHSRQELILRGYTLADLGLNSRCKDHLIWSIYRELREDRPEVAVRKYRWLLEGASRTSSDRSSTGADSPAFRELRELLEADGWHFLRVNSRRDPRNGKFDLRVELRLADKKVVLKHYSGQRHESVGEDDEVIVLAQLIAELEPVFSNPAITIYALELQPAAPPSHAVQQYVEKWERELL